MRIFQRPGGWIGWDGSPGGRGYRAPYGANNVQWTPKRQHSCVHCVARDPFFASTFCPLHPYNPHVLGSLLKD